MAVSEESFSALLRMRSIISGPRAWAFLCPASGQVCAPGSPPFPPPVPRALRAPRPLRHCPSTWLLSLLGPRPSPHPPLPRCRKGHFAPTLTCPRCLTCCPRRGDPALRPRPARSPAKSAPPPRAAPRVLCACAVTQRQSLPGGRPECMCACAERCVLVTMVARASSCRLKGQKSQSISAGWCRRRAVVTVSGARAALCGDRGTPSGSYFRVRIQFWRTTQRALS